MKDKNVVILNAHCACGPCNKVSSIIETFYMVYGQGRGNVGSARHTPYMIESEYSCKYCGIMFKPTDENKLDVDHQSRLKKATKLLQETHVVRLNRTLMGTEVFEKLGNVYSGSFDSPAFRKDRLLRIENAENFLGKVDATTKELYIVPPGRGEDSKIIEWAPYRWRKIRNLKGEKKLMKHLLEFEKDMKNLNKKFELARKRPVRLSNLTMFASEPLPKNAIKVAVCHLVDERFKNIYYIPADAISSSK